MDLNKFQETYLRVINEETQTEALSANESDRLDNLLANSTAQTERLSSTVSKLIKVYSDTVNLMDQEEKDIRR